MGPLIEVGTNPSHIMSWRRGDLSKDIARFGIKGKLLSGILMSSFILIAAVPNSPISIHSEQRDDCSTHLQG